MYSKGLSVLLKGIDRQIWDQELSEFVPEKLYDVHTHIYDWRSDSQEVSNRTLPPVGIWSDWPISNWEMLEEADKCLFPGRVVHRICLGNPLQDCSLDDANRFVASEIANDSQSVALMLVRPTLSQNILVRQIERYKFCGLKPYRTYSVSGDAVECRITDFLPEKQIEIANHYELMITLHLSKRQAIADPDNLDDLERLTKTYPNVKWILAHCARSYYDGPLLKAADRLKTIPNLWYDISSVCDSDAMDVLLSIAGPTRVMYGSDDLPVGITRGKYITFGYAWAELNETNHQFNLSHCHSEMTFVRYESLRALRRACRRHGYGKKEQERLFYDNAKELIDSTRKKPFDKYNIPDV